MISEDVKEKLQELNIEDFIWLIYIGIIALSYLSNYYERKYFLHKSDEARNIYRKIMIIIFSVLVIVYFYFLYSSYSSLKEVNKYNNKKKNLVLLSFLSSLLITISGLIYLYIAIVDENIDVEIAFN